ncbi:MAG: hypothetical protein RMK29_07530 [Myxococcales bacterium]|nr:serine/threonine protein kinase [Myxococcota bacterium]MDW8281545.1 hypothetical protein [Myxococcales bacterium]
MKSAPAVTSVHGRRYQLGGSLGRGGQGAVYTVAGDPTLAVKLLEDPSRTLREQLRDQLAMVGRLPLDGLPLAHPLELLRPPHVGYVMRLLSGMAPLRSLMRPPDGSSVASWYIQGGGLRRRLRVLARAAEVLATLHGRGLVFVDPSPTNVFVSVAVEAEEVGLIDTDNLRPSTSPGHTVYTPGYGAPELVRGTGGATSLSDAYAFAVLAYETLTLTHPFLGDMVQNGEPELEEQALAGELPWVDDPDDDRNRASSGIPSEFILSDNLRRIFHETFAAGRADPMRRPGMTRWVEFLHRAADRTLLCPACRATFYCDRRTCPWCEEPRPASVIAAVLIWDPATPRSCGRGGLEHGPGILRDGSGKPRVVDAVFVSAGDQVVLTDRVTHGTDRRAPRLQVAFDGTRLTLQSLDDEPWRLVSSDGRYERTLGQTPEEISVGPSGTAWMLHAGRPEQRHRVIRFDFYPRGTP